jgi:hypothetical protein
MTLYITLIKIFAKFYILDHYLKGIRGADFLFNFGCSCIF